MWGGGLKILVFARPGNTGPYQRLSTKDRERKTLRRSTREEDAGENSQET